MRAAGRLADIFGRDRCWIEVQRHWLPDDNRLIAGLLAAAADPEREYVQVILPAKLQHAAEYAERASLATDLGVLWRTLRLLLRQV